MASPAVTNVVDKLLEFEAKVNDYCVTVPEIKKNVQHIRNWVVTQEASANQTDVGKVAEVVQTSISLLDDLRPLMTRRRETTRVIKGCLNIASSVLTMAVGPYGAAANAICNILSAIMSQSSPTKDDMATKLLQEITKKVHKEFLGMQGYRFYDLQSRVNLMVRNLKISKNEALPDQALFESDFPQFLGKVAEDFNINGSNLKSEDHLENAVCSVVVYCKAQTAHILLLANVIAAFKSSGRETKFVKELLERAFKDFIQKLGVLSKEQLRRANDKSQNQVGMKSQEFRNQILLAMFVRQNQPAYSVIEKFREGLGMPDMPTLTEIQSVALEELQRCPNDVVYLYPQPHTWGESHHFQLINHTEFPIKASCGQNVGDQVNKLKFQCVVEPYSSYEHQATRNMNWSFSTGGVLAVYLDGNLPRSNESMPYVEDMKVFEFALSISYLGWIQTSAMLDVSSTEKSRQKDQQEPKQLKASGQDCYNYLKRIEGCESPPIYFDYKGKSYTAYNRYSRSGKNNCQTCRFVVAEYHDDTLDTPKN